MWETIKYFFTPNDWQLVASLESPMRWGSKEKGYDEGTLIYHLYESQKGIRKYDIATTLNEDGDHFKTSVRRYSRTTDIYQKRIFRWLKGRHDPTIPRYCEISEEDTANQLKGDI